MLGYSTNRTGISFSSVSDFVARKDIPNISLGRNVSRSLSRRLGIDSFASLPLTFLSDRNNVQRAHSTATTPRPYPIVLNDISVSQTNQCRPPLLVRSQNFWTSPTKLVWHQKATEQLQQLRLLLRLANGLFCVCIYSMYRLWCCRFLRRHPTNSLWKE